MPGGNRCGAERWEVGARAGMPRLAWSWKEKRKRACARPDKTRTTGHPRSPRGTGRSDGRSTAVSRSSAAQKTSLVLRLVSMKGRCMESLVL